MTVVEYLRGLAGKRTQYGECDCLLAVADWARELTGVDVGALYRGTYNSEEGWRAIVAANGGIVRLVDSTCDDLGLVRIREPVAGDLGVVDLPEVGLMGAICSGSRWVMLTDRGLAALTTPAARVATAWGRR